jgi:Ca-activated chloride channel family protein
VLVLAVGSQDSGVLHDAKGMPRLDAVGNAVQGRFDKQGLQGLAKAADAPLGSLTLNDDDLDWIELHARQHYQAATGDSATLHWKDAGYWLCWPLLLLALGGLRKGWRVNWLAGLAVLCVLGAAPGQVWAGELADAFSPPTSRAAGP